MYQLYAIQNDSSFYFPLTIGVKNKNLNINYATHEDKIILELFNIDKNIYKKICITNNGIEIDGEMQFRYIKDIENVIDELWHYILPLKLQNKINWVGEILL